MIVRLIARTGSRGYLVLIEMHVLDQAATVGPYRFGV
jgi:ribosomal protein S28E/S33